MKNININDDPQSDEVCSPTSKPVGSGRGLQSDEGGICLPSASPFTIGPP